MLASRKSSGQGTPAGIRLYRQLDPVRPSLSVHRLFKKGEYRASVLVAAPDEQLTQEQHILDTGEVPR